jgi:hypothetical protein
VLEYLVHVDPRDMPGDLVARPAVIPDELAIRRIQIDGLPAGWQSYPAPEELAGLGTEWIRRGATAVLAVPSVVIPTEWNYLLNPAHPDFERIDVGASQPYSFDPRLLARRRREMR